MDIHTCVYILVAFLLGARGLLINHNQTQGLSLSERVNALEKQLADEKKQRFLLQMEYDEEKQRLAEFKNLQDTMNETDQKLLQAYNAAPKQFQDISTQIRGSLMSINNLDSKHSLDIQKVLDTLRDVQTSLTDTMSNQSGIFQLQQHFQEKQNVLSSMLDAVKRNQTTNKENIKNLRASLTSLANSQKTLQSTATSNSNEQASLKVQLNKIMDPVIFLSNGLLNLYHMMWGLTVPQNTVVKFGVVQINEGGGYNKNTGTFTCPSEGYYSFHWSVSAYDYSKPCFTAITKNGNSFLESKIGGKLVTVHMNINDRVWIKATSECKIVPHHSSFSGFKIV